MFVFAHKGFLEVPCNMRYNNRVDHSGFNNHTARRNFLGVQFYSRKSIFVAHEAGRH